MKVPARTAVPFYTAVFLLIIINVYYWVTMEKAPERKRQSKSQLSRRESNPQNTFYSTLKDTSIICITIHLRRVHWKLDTFGSARKERKLRN
ncbi:hypothetical protein EB796_006931 [Bugula neritina]|uniref:Uncharacterized protein n=1 Tax=Bugula neritina TaxID=10212 RepID=A0A7J7KAX8_BUGNE|nr:hypothetical protein EB796_006931 [Bugula neritina]